MAAAIKRAQPIWLLFTGTSRCATSSCAVSVRSRECSTRSSWINFLFSLPLDQSEPWSGSPDPHTVVPGTEKWDSKEKNLHRLCARSCQRAARTSGLHLFPTLTPDLAPSTLNSGPAGPNDAAKICKVVELRSKFLLTLVHSSVSR